MVFQELAIHTKIELNSAHFSLAVTLSTSVEICFHFDG